MIRHTHVSHLFKKVTPKKEENKKVEESVIVKKTRRKTEKVAVSVEEPVILDEPIIENNTADNVEDLSKWLEEHTED